VEFKSKSEIIDGPKVMANPIMTRRRGSHLKRRRKRKAILVATREKKKNKINNIITLHYTISLSGI
jgi:hypothetical protein